MQFSASNAALSATLVQGSEAFALSADGHLTLGRPGGQTILADGDILHRDESGFSWALKNGELALAALPQP